MEKLEFYVLNYDINARKVVVYNIFQNSLVLEHSLKAIRKYIRSPKRFTITKNTKVLYGFDALCEEIRSIIMWQEWSRCQYEIGVSGLFSDEIEKWDCYRQALPNIRAITREILWQYKEQKKCQL